MVSCALGVLVRAVPTDGCGGARAARCRDELATQVASRVRPDPPTILHGSVCGTAGLLGLALPGKVVTLSC